MITIWMSIPQFNQFHFTGEIKDLWLQDKLRFEISTEE